MNKYHKQIEGLFKQALSLSNSKNCIDNLLGNKQVILYGAGDGFITFSIFILKKYGLKAYAILDHKFKANETYYGIPAFSPLQYFPTHEIKENSVAVITVGKSEYHAEIFNCLRDLGFKNIILASDIYEYHLHHAAREIRERKLDYYLDKKEQILSCLDIFSDDLSREVFTLFIQTHLLRKPIHIPSRDLSEQYFPKDINLSKGYSRFINCGAYNGDTILQLNTLRGKIDSVVCFEPDSENFALLVRYLCVKHKEIAEEIIAFPCGVFSCETQLRFTGGEKINSVISDQGSSIIQCVALDHVIPDFKPTFISMDVEGAECEALKGAEALIKSSKPDLAICVYHSPNHIWDIPFYLEGLHLGYKYYLRNYTSFVAETVLYATVEKGAQ
jgi:FkbM family methyltransferase